MSHPVSDVCVQEAADAAASDSVLLLDVSAVPTDRPVSAVCRSGKATAALAQAGVDVVNMAGGMIAWAAAGLPVVDADGRPGDIA
jgi:rhodanese-related sulfurtransferase